MKFLDRITIIAFIVGIYSLYVALENLEENRDQNDELKKILDYLEVHLQDQDNHLHKQDKLLENLMKGE